MKQRSILSISIKSEILSVLIILSVLVTSAFVLINQINVNIENSLTSTIQSIESSIGIYLEERQNEFENMVAMVVIDDPSSLGSHYKNLRDIYYLDEDLKIRTIYKKSKNSRVFENYSFSQSATAAFFNQAFSEKMSVSPIIRSTENDSVSIYFTAKKGEGLVVARIDLATIQIMLQKVASAYDRIVLISSKDGYVLTSSHNNLPFEIIPKGENLPSALGEPYIITTYKSLIIQNNIITLTPARIANGSRNTIVLTLAIVGLLILISFFIKILAIKSLVIKPLNNMLVQINKFDVSGSIDKRDQILNRSKEASDLHDAFMRKSQIVEAQYKRIDQERQNAVLKLIESEKLSALGSLVAGVAHEVNTPIGNSITSVSYLQSEHNTLVEAFNHGTLSKNELFEYLKEEEEILNIVTLSLERASNLISNFKLLAVEQSTETALEFDLNEQINSVVNVLKHQLEQGNHHVEVHSDEKVLLKTRPTFIHQIFTNLIMNSILHGFEHIKNGIIQIDVQKTDQIIRIHYRDNGCGVPAEYAKRIFEPFFTTKRSTGGSGLGMNIVSNIISNGLNGSITLDQQSEQGMHLIIELPSISSE